MSLTEDLDIMTTAVGVAPYPRDVIEVRGPDAQTFLQGQLSQDLAAVVVGSSRRSFLLQPQGKLDAWFRISNLGDDRWIIDLDPGWAERVVARLSRFKLRVDAEITPLRWDGLAVRGPLTAEVEAVAAIIEDARWPGIDGVDLLGEHLQMPPAVSVCGAEVLEVLRIEAGIPAMGKELDESTIPAETGLVASSVSFTKGCYVGQELVARMDSRGGNAPGRLHRLVIDADDISAGAEVQQAGAPVGAITSAVWSPARAATVALAMLKRSADPDADLLVGGGRATASPVEMIRPD